jgi:hypothetical protein
MEALGRLFNIVPTADAVEVACRDCSAVTFVGIGTDTYTVEQATDAAGAGAASLAVITRYFRSTSAAGAAVWTLVTQAAAATFAATSSGIAVAHIDVKSMGDGFDYLRCSSAGAGLVIAITHDLNVQRDPRNLPAPAV